MRAVFFLMLAFFSLHHAEEGSAALVERGKPRSERVVVLVHGWGRMPRKPHSVWKSKIQPYSDLSTLKKRFEDLGFTRVFTLEYDDLKSLDHMASTVAEQMHKIISMTRVQNLTLDVVGHSMGQFVAAKAIWDKKYSVGKNYLLSDRVRIFIGLAGIVRGQDELYPCTIFPGQCGGGGALEPFYANQAQGSLEVKKLFFENFDVISRMKKCSVYSEADEIVKTPYNSASFRGLGLEPRNVVDVEINSRREKFHNDVKESASIFRKIISNCYQLVGGA